jgi:hypothetical protein
VHNLLCSDGSAVSPCGCAGQLWAGGRGGYCSSQASRRQAGSRGCRHSRGPHQWSRKEQTLSTLLIWINQNDYLWQHWFYCGGMTSSKRPLGYIDKQAYTANI